MSPYNNHLNQVDIRNIAFLLSNITLADRKQDVIIGD